MDSKTFDTIVTRQIDKSYDILADKGEEYATEDRLHNFRVSAKLQGTTMRHALAGMMAKHTTSVYDMIQDPISYHDAEKWDEKITDHINYLLILQAVLHEERKEDDGSDQAPKIDLNKTQGPFSLHSGVPPTPFSPHYQDYIQSPNQTNNPT